MAKHGPAIDDELKNERKQASAGTRHDGRPEDTEADTKKAPEDDTYIGVRAEIARFLGPAAFPGFRADLLTTAQDNDATDDVLRVLRDLPEDLEFHTTQEVVDAIPLNPSQPDG